MIDSYLNKYDIITLGIGMDNIYLLYGENTRRIENRREEIVEKSKADDFNISTFDMEESSFMEAISEASMMPFLSDYRVVIFKNCYFLDKAPKKSKSKKKQDDSVSSNDEYSKLIEYINNPNESTIHIFEVNVPTLESKNDIVAALMKKCKPEQFKDYTPEEIRIYIDKRLKATNHSITNEAKTELLKRLENNPSNFINELEKLIVYLKSDEQITIKEVNELIIKDPEDNVFNLTNAIVERKRKEALRIYYELLEKGHEPKDLYYLIVSKFQELLYSQELLNLRVSKEEFAKYFHISEGRAYYQMKNARSIDPKSVRRCINSLADLDYKIKSGTQDLDSELELFLLKI